MGRPQVRLPDLAPGATKALHERWGWMIYWAGGRQFACELVAAPDAKTPKRAAEVAGGWSLLRKRAEPLRERRYGDSESA